MATNFRLVYAEDSLGVSALCFDTYESILLLGVRMCFAIPFSSGPSSAIISGPVVLKKKEGTVALKEHWGT